MHDRQTSMSLAGFDPATSESERPETHDLDRVATGIESCITVLHKLKNLFT